ncbi:carboxymuconolactone decarboxylase family protein [Azospirillum melinis]|uniref:Carboxymuconolactone decarboxylase family protein n=1 Tax=Azospirillum melinis TaxID=328839 RepID=A0ABX2K734_9PROT|nr:carboxymuconolactone decarboxylase family protein [Azospirillum melinis]MBP2306356.1 AhpD family alkylhydroperoxidase [Azospirillum melinis]NUA98286.1 carboxymuconolactone decarboxylase family protein [Azospirillum melinis]
MDDAKTDLAAAKARLGAFAKASPALMKGFAEVSRTASAAGSFTSAQKELMAVAISVATRCEDCILYHVDGARRHGAAEADLVEALEVAVEMGGGPAVMYAGKALAAFRSLG